MLSDDLADAHAMELPPDRRTRLASFQYALAMDDGLTRRIEMEVIELDAAAVRAAELRGARTAALFL
jgi:hypothetical protein